MILKKDFDWSFTVFVPIYSFCREGLAVNFLFLLKIKSEQ